MRLRGGCAHSPWLAAALLAQYACLVGAGFVAYVLALVRLERWLAERGVSRGKVPALDLRGLVGVLTVPQPRTVAVLVVLFAALAGGAAMLRALPAIMNRAVRAA